MRAKSKPRRLAIYHYPKREGWPATRALRPRNALFGSKPSSSRSTGAKSLAPQIFTPSPQSPHINMKHTINSTTHSAPLTTAAASNILAHPSNGFEPQPSRLRFPLLSSQPVLPSKSILPAEPVFPSQSKFSDTTTAATSPATFSATL